MSRNLPTIRIPASALREFEDVENMDWSEGFLLDELLDWINEVAARFMPPEIGEDSRASKEFSAGTFRHYQTLGCIDTPERRGRQVVYKFRHYVQALLLRRLLWERIPSERIAQLVAGRSTEDLKRILFQGIEVVAQNSGDELAPVAAAGEDWRRIPVAPGIEVHIRKDLAKPNAKTMKQWISALETVLRKNFQNRR